MPGAAGHGADRAQFRARGRAGFARRGGVGRRRTRQRGKPWPRCWAGHGFRLYGNADAVGAQVGGAAKNVVAVAAGAVIGAGLGENARAALITRGLAEISRLAVALGGQAETVAGLSGMGDLVLTCTGAQSRNFSLGVALGRGACAGGNVRARRRARGGGDCHRPCPAGTRRQHWTCRSAKRWQRYWPAKPTCPP